MSAMRNSTPVASPADMYGEQYERGHSRLGHVIRHPRECETPIAPFLIEEEDDDDREVFEDDDLADSVVLDDHLLDRLDPEDVSDGSRELPDNDEQQLLAHKTQSNKGGVDNEAVTPVDE